MLIVGFAWIAAQQLSGLLRMGARSVVDSQFSQLSPDSAHVLSAPEVKLRILGAVRETYDLFPLVILPGILMLIGGVVVGRSGRPSVQKRAQPDVQPAAPEKPDAPGN